MTLPPANGRDGGLSWERDREVEHYTPSERVGGGGNFDKGGMMANGGSGLLLSPRKRPRADSGTLDSRRPSPTMRGKAAGIVGAQDSIDPNGDAHGSGIKEE